MEYPARGSPRGRIGLTRGWLTKSPTMGVSDHVVRDREKRSDVAISETCGLGRAAEQASKLTAQAPRLPRFARNDDCG